MLPVGEVKGYKHCCLVFPDRILPSAYIVFRDGRIDAFGKMSDAEPARLADLEDAKNAYVLPGFVDIHCHGGAGSDVMDASPEALQTISCCHAAGGTTTFLATTSAEPVENIACAIDNVRQCRDHLRGAQVPGMHLEGPYFNRNKKGCHRVEYVRNPDEKEYLSWLRTGLVRHITLAPELPGAETLIKECVKQGTTVSLGHSEATYQEVMQAIRWGASHVTHMYCAMSGTVKKGYQKGGGLAEAALLEDALTTEVIADGKHLSAELIRLVLKVKGPDKVCVVTDAMRGTGMPAGKYYFGSPRGTLAIVKEGMSVMPDGSGMASSVCRMIDMFHYMVKQVGIDLMTASRLFSLTPAKIIRADTFSGSIDVGKQADVIVLDNEYRLVYTVVKGKVVYQNG